MLHLYHFTISRALQSRLLSVFLDSFLDSYLACPPPPWPAVLSGQSPGSFFTLRSPEICPLVKKTRVSLPLSMFDLVQLFSCLSGGCCSHLPVTCPLPPAAWHLFCVEICETQVSFFFFFFGFNFFEDQYTFNSHYRDEQFHLHF